MSKINQQVKFRYYDEASPTDDEQFVVVVGTHNIVLEGTLDVAQHKVLAELAEAVGSAWKEADNNGKRARAKLEGFEVEV